MFGRRRRAPRGFERYVRQRVIVHTRDRQSFRGFVLHDDDATIVLDHAEKLSSVAGEVGLEARALAVGEIAIAHSNVSVVQRVADVPDEPLEQPAAPTVGIDRVVPLVSEVAS